MFKANYIRSNIAMAETKTKCIRRARKYCRNAIKYGHPQISSFDLMNDSIYLETHICDNSGNHWKVNFNAYRPDGTRSNSANTPEMNNPDAKYNYMMLSRLQADCDYFLNYGGRNIKHLWAGNVSDQIQKMKDIYNTLPEPPDWITMAQIEEYEKQMKEITK